MPFTRTSMLEGRVAIITGASSGIGAYTARALASAGATVSLWARRRDRLDELSREIVEGGGVASAEAVDVTSADEIASAAERVRDAFGDASILVNNAGLMLPTPVLAGNAIDASRQVALNITAVNDLTRLVVPQLVASASSAGVADLVNIASIAARTPFPRFSVYSGTKAYVAQFGTTLRAELAPLGVRVSTIEPGIVDTELTSHIQDDDVRGRIVSTRDAVDWLLPEDVADLIRHVVSLPPRVSLPEVVVLPTKQV